MTKRMSMKRIHKVTIKRMADESPDTSWLGEYSSKAETEYAIDRAHDLDCPVNSPYRESDNSIEDSFLCANCEHSKAEHGKGNGKCAVCDCESWELDSAHNDCNCGGHGDMERNQYRYFNGNVENYRGESPETIRKYVRQDYERMERLNAGDWCFVGVRAEAEYYVATKANPATQEHGAFLMQKVTSGGCWGIESDSDEGHFQSIEKEELGELSEQLHAVGFSRRAIAAAMKNINRKDN